MRRKDREVTDYGKISKVIAASHCCRLGFYEEGEVYIVPILDMRKKTASVSSISTARKKGVSWI
mgnify:CR=1 FL=1